MAFAIAEAEGVPASGGSGAGGAGALLASGMGDLAAASPEPTGAQATELLSPSEEKRRLNSAKGMREVMGVGRDTGSR